MQKRVKEKVDKAAVGTPERLSLIAKHVLLHWTIYQPDANVVSHEKSMRYGIRGMDGPVRFRNLSLSRRSSKRILFGHSTDGVEGIKGGFSLLGEMGISQRARRARRAAATFLTALK